MADRTYDGREQTKAKHYILRRYLQALAFKIFTFSDIAYVDAFSGPWKSASTNFQDTSFIIAIKALKEAQEQYLKQTGTRRTVKCYFVEKGKRAHSRLAAAVEEYHKPEEGFEVITRHGAFEDSVDAIDTFIGSAFALIFIDPTGWSGYALEKIARLFNRRKVETLINFMYDHINRAAGMTRDKRIIASLGKILGGPNWQERLDPKLSRGRAVEKLFREALKAAGGFDYVVSTKIDRSTADRPHFFLVYGTKSPHGLKEFRQNEYDTLRLNARDRADAQERKSVEKTGTPDLFAGLRADTNEASIEQVVAGEKLAAASALLSHLASHGPMKFIDVWIMLLQAYMLRVTDVKTICATLASEDKIGNTWGGGNHKPKDDSIIKLK